MSIPNTSEKSVYLDREEHVHKGQLGAKRVVNYLYDSDTDTLVPQEASSGGAVGLLPFEFDDIQFSNPDANGNYQTAVVENNGSTVATLTLSYDGDSKLTGVTRT